mmetsp:Transcript_1849/g.1438  ORF Transcript_1849/g.1438 Transcript_1849/m.1438 type:complete len:100 (-) Transcript_1849:58-357(-)
MDESVFFFFFFFLFGSLRIVRETASISTPAEAMLPERVADWARSALEATTAAAAAAAALPPRGLPLAVAAVGIVARRTLALAVTLPPSLVFVLPVFVVF